MTDATEAEGDGIWRRLRRRKVVQWGLAYAAGAWGLLQGLQFLTDAFEWPGNVLRLATVLLLLGLPVALVLAWYHGDKGQQRVSRTELAIVTLLFLIGGGIFWNYQHTHLSPESPQVAQATSVPAPPTALPTDRSIAVLPFVNMSADKEQEYFADGISEELLSLLAQIPELRVIARTSSFSFKGKDTDIATIARTLNVANVLEGSVRRSGDQLRITAQLIRTTDSSQLWSQTYDRQLTDVFAIQDEIAAAVVDELRIKLLGSAPKTKTTNLEAYGLFLQARETHRQFTAAAFRQAIDLYQQSLALDPGYAAAWVGLASVYCDQFSIYLLPAAEAIPLARDAATRALEADPEYAPAHARLGWISTYHDGDLAEAARQVERALALEPADPDILAIAAGLSRSLGRLDQAIALGDYLSVRDPLNLQGGYELATAYFYAGRLDEALAAYRADLRLFPDGIGEREMIGEVLLAKGDARAALAEIEQEPDDAIRLVGLSLAYYALGDQAKSDDALEELIDKHETTMSWSIALVFAFRGEADQAFEWLDKAAQTHDPTVVSTAGYPLLKRLHSDPRWLPFLRKHGMAPEQLAAIKFEVKLPE